MLAGFGVCVCESSACREKGKNACWAWCVCVCEVESCTPVDR